jgi:peptidoglycan/xylan/chitin deacetylase (PgdA/CDA1 family)
MSIRPYLGAVRSEILHRFQRRCVTLGSHEPIVSFTFDDFPRSAYSMGGSILAEFGARGTYYAASSLMNTSGELGEHFTAEDVCSLVEQGHELANHTFSHVSARSVSSSDFCADAEHGKLALEKLAGRKVNNFSYPFGHVTLRTKKSLGEEVASARGISPGLNEPEIDLNLLRANRIYGDLDQLDSLNALIEGNVRRGGWLIFYTHDIRSQPSPYGCTPELFELIVSRAFRSGSGILTIQAALAELAAGTSSHLVESREEVRDVVLGRR